MTFTEAGFLGALRVNGKGNVERKYVYQDRTFQAEMFDTGLIKIKKLTGI